MLLTKAIIQPAGTAEETQDWQFSRRHLSLLSAHRLSVLRPQASSNVPLQCPQPAGPVAPWTRPSCRRRFLVRVSPCCLSRIPRRRSGSNRDAAVLRSERSPVRCYVATWASSTHDSFEMAVATGVAMPEATVYMNHCSPFWQHDVRLPGQALPMQPESVTHLAAAAARALRCGILRPNAAHDLRPSFLGIQRSCLPPLPASLLLPAHIAICVGRPQRCPASRTCLS